VKICLQLLARYLNRYVEGVGPIYIYLYQVWVMTSCAFIFRRFVYAKLLGKSYFLPVLSSNLYAVEKLRGYVHMKKICRIQFHQQVLLDCSCVKVIISFKHTHFRVLSIRFCFVFTLL